MYILLLLGLFFFHIGIIMIAMGGAGMLEIGSLFCLFSTILIIIALFKILSKKKAVIMYILLLLGLFFFHIGIIMIAMGGAGMLEIGSLFCLFSTILIIVALFKILSKKKAVIMYILLLLGLFFFHIGIIMIAMGGAGMLEIGSLFCLFSTILIIVALFKILSKRKGSVNKI